MFALAFQFSDCDMAGNRLWKPFCRFVKRRQHLSEIIARKGLGNHPENSSLPFQCNPADSISPVSPEGFRTLTETLHHCDAEAAWEADCSPTAVLPITPRHTLKKGLLETFPFHFPIPFRSE
jgi:hypothetical protein